MKYTTQWMKKNMTQSVEKNDLVELRVHLTGLSNLFQTDIHKQDENNSSM
jgi:hypothetical protein